MADTYYNNSVSGLAATDVQTAVDAVYNKVNLLGNVDNYTSNVTYDSNGYVSRFITPSIDIKNIVYTNVGILLSEYKITSYTETTNGITKTITVTYNNDGSINTIVAV